MSGYSLRIEPLGKENYETWKLQIEAVLTKNDAWGYVDGSIPKPSSSSLETTAQEWDDNDRKAKSDIILAISPSELRQVKNCKTARDVWLTLQSIYDSSGPARKATLLKQLIFTKMEEGGNMRDHLQTFFQIVDKLEEMEISIVDDLLTILLLYSIPMSFDNFRIAIESRDELPKPETLKIKLLEEFDARKGRQETYSGAMYANKKAARQAKEKIVEPNKTIEPSKNNPKENVKKQFPFNCYKCGKKGHMAKVCKGKLQQLQQKASQAGSALNIEQNISMNADSHKDTMSWCLDSGASSHMCAVQDKFVSINETNCTTLKLANNDTTTIQGMGQVGLKVTNPKGLKPVTLNETLYIPDLRTNLLSVSKATDHGFDVIFRKNSAFIMSESGDIIAKADRTNNLYYIQDHSENAQVASVAKSNLEEWHERMGHLNEKSLKEMSSKKQVFGFHFDSKVCLPQCEICIKGKHTRAPFPKESSTRSAKPLELVHTDICGPMRTQSLGGSKYFVTFIDDYSRFCFVYFLQKRSDLLETFEKFKLMAETQTGEKIKVLRSDNGAEYKSQKFEEFLERNGIRHQTSIEYTPQQNGVAERKNRTLEDMARCMLIQSNLPPSFWAEAILTASYVRNHCPSRSINGNIPIRLWTNKKPTVKHFRTFGQRVLMLDRKPGKSKFAPRSVECIFVGYETDSKAYRVWCPETRQIFRSRDIKFLSRFDKEPEEKFTTDELLSKQEEPKLIEVDLNPRKDQQCSEEVPVPENNENVQHQQRQKMTRGRGRPSFIRTGKPGRPKKQYKEVPETAQEEEENQVFLVDHLDPQDISEALSSPEAQNWKRAMKEELDALAKNQTWTIVERPEKKNVIDSKWVYRTKFKADGSVERRKARLVAKGYLQKPGVDFQETYAPVARLSSVRTVTALAAKYSLAIHQLDFTAAYLNGELEEEIYMELPPGMDEDQGRQTGRDRVCLLKKALYGLKQSGRQWYKRLDMELKRKGFKPLDADPCVYILNENETFILIVLYVDDIIIASNNLQKLKNVKQELSNMFDMKDMGEIQFCLGIKFEKKNGTISISQTQYIKTILARFQMEDCKPMMTPMDCNHKLRKSCEQSVDENDDLKKIPYQQLVGSLMYLSVCTRPDITYAVSVLSQFNSCFTKDHWTAAKRVLRYLKETINYGLVFDNAEDKLTGYADSDWGNDTEDRRSYTGYLFTFANAAISWESRKQRTVALSSTEAEYMALSESAKEAIYLKGLLSEIVKQKNVTIHCDNQSAQRLAENPLYHARTKHIDIRHHFIRQVCERDVVKLEYLPTEDMPADFLTKALTKEKHWKCMKEVGLRKVIV